MNIREKGTWALQWCSRERSARDRERREPRTARTANGVTENGDRRLRGSRKERPIEKADIGERPIESAREEVRVQW